jgi:hypothetical protein
MDAAWFRILAKRDVIIQDRPTPLLRRINYYQGQLDQDFGPHEYHQPTIHPNGESSRTQMMRRKLSGLRRLNRLINVSAVILRLSVLTDHISMAITYH